MAASRTAHQQNVTTAITASGRVSFAKIREPLEVPDLLALQTDSFDWLLGNERWAARLAEGAGGAGIDLILISTNEVFDGRRTDGAGYGPHDQPDPINAYGSSKLAGEVAAAAAFGWIDGRSPGHGPALAIARTAWLYGPPGNDFPEKIALAAERARAAGEALRVVADETGSPTFTADLAAAIVTLGTDKRRGIFHVTNSGTTTWCGFVRAIFEAAGADPERVHPITTAELDPPRPAPRPANWALDNMALRLSGLPALPDWHGGMVRLVNALGSRGEQP